jgi:hypothetical protein
MFSLGCTILLVSMRAGDTMGNANSLEEWVQLFLLTTPIRLHGDDLFIELSFY